MNIFNRIRRLFFTPLYMAESEFMSIYNLNESELAFHKSITSGYPPAYKYREMTKEEIKEHG